MIYYGLDVTNIKCGICKINFTPDEKDISTKNPNKYYKTCFTCREKKRLYMKEYLKKNITL